MMDSTGEDMSRPAMRVLPFNNYQLVKLVSGNGGSKRVTIPKDIVEKLCMKDTKYVAIAVGQGNHVVIAPVSVVMQTLKGKRIDI